MQKFKVGDIVIPLSNPFNKYSQKRKKGVPCEVTAIMYCSKEGFQLINVDNNSAPKVADGFLSCSCGELHLSNDIAWTDASEFIKADNLEHALEIAVANEDWDLAIRLRDLNN